VSQHVIAEDTMITKFRAKLHEAKQSNDKTTAKVIHKMLILKKVRSVAQDVGVLCEQISRICYDFSVLEKQLQPTEISRKDCQSSVKSFSMTERSRENCESSLKSYRGKLKTLQAEYASPKDADVSGISNTSNPLWKVRYTGAMNTASATAKSLSTELRSVTLSNVLTKRALTVLDTYMQQTVDCTHMFIQFVHMVLAQLTQSYAERKLQHTIDATICSQCESLFENLNCILNKLPGQVCIEEYRFFQAKWTGWPNIFQEMQFFVDRQDWNAILMRIYPVCGVVDKRCNDDIVVSDLRLELDEAKKTLASQDRTIKMLKDALETSESEYHMELDEARKTHAKEIEMLKKAVSESRRKANALENEDAGATRKAGALAIKCDQALLLVKKLQSGKDKATNSVRYLKAELDGVQSDLKNRDDRLDQLKEDRERDLVQVHGQLEDLRSDFSEVQTKLESEAHVRAQLYTDCLTLRSDNLRLNDQNTELQDFIDKLNIENDSLTRRLDEHSISPVDQVSDIICKSTDREALTQLQRNIENMKRQVERKIMECCYEQVTTMSQKLQCAQEAQSEAEEQNKEYKKQLSAMLMDIENAKRETERVKTEAESNKAMCVICTEAAAEHLWYPCGHFNICGSCPQDPKFKGECPICQKPSELIKVFQS